MALARNCCGSQPGRGEADDDGIVAGENEIDENDLQEGRQHTVIKTKGHADNPPG
jgi:hypothetical protein